MELAVDGWRKQGAELEVDGLDVVGMTSGNLAHKDAQGPAMRSQRSLDYR